MKLYVSVVLVMGAMLVSAKENNEYQVQFGAAKVDITSPINTKLPCWKRKSKSVAVHDPLYAQVVAVKDFKGKVVLFIRGDTIKFPVSVVEYVRKHCKNKYNISKEYIVVSASHTHNAPILFVKIIGREAYNATCEKLCRAVDTAMSSLRSGYLKIGRTESDLGVSRRWYNPATRRIKFRPDATGKTDKTTTVMAFYDLHDKLGALIWIYGCHNTGYGAYVDGKAQITADWSGEVDRLLEKRFGSGVIVAFMQGAAGDVKARFIAKKLEKGVPQWHHPSSAEMKAFAEKYAAPLIDFIRDGKGFKREKVDFAAAMGKFTLHSDTTNPRHIWTQHLKTKGELEAVINSDTASTAQKQQCKGFLRSGWYVGGKRVRTWQGQKVRINSTTQILTFSGEPTSGFAELLYKAFPGKENIIIGYAIGKGHLGDYLTNYRQVYEGGYEGGGMFPPSMDKTIMDFYKNLDPK